MHQVYRGINRTTGEVYHGVSKDPKARRDGSHCVGGTKALSHWDCDSDEIQWRIVSQHRTQTKASQVAHGHERSYRHRRGYRNIETSGI